MDPQAVRNFTARAAAIAENLFPGTVTIAGVSYPCAIGDPPAKTTAIAGGLHIGAELTVSIRKEILPDPPATGTVLEAKEEKWIILTVTGHSANCAVWTLRCEPKS